MATNTSRDQVFDSLLSSTQEKYHKNGIPQDAIFNQIAVLEALRGKGAFKEKTTGGEVIAFNVIKESNGTGKSYSGYEPANNAPQDEFTRGFDQWRQYSWMTTISGIEEFKNKGKERIFDLLAEKAEVTYMTAAEDLNRDIMDIANINSSTGAMGNGGKNINSLPFVVGKSAESYAVHAITAGTDSYWAARATDGSGYTTARALIQGIRHNINTANRARGAGKVDLLVFDQVTHENFVEALNDKVRYMSTDSASPGFNKVNYGGIECIWDIYMPEVNAGTNGGPDVTLTTGSIYGLNSKCMSLYCGEGRDFTSTPFVDGTYAAQDARQSMMTFYGQLIADSRRNHFVAYKIPAAITAD